MRDRIVAVNLLVLLLAGSALCQQSTPPPRPKLALVLEGGSALGLAHIGVLKWLEEHRIPVNYVAGTSMGGLVGGIYATGHNAAELEALVKSIDWDEVLQGQTPYKDMSFRRKQDATEYPNHLEFGIKKGLQFPEGFNSGQQVLSILDRVALPYSEVQNFNELPIPFACVATDLVTDSKFVFQNGSLSLALRSTMSLPGIFTPVRWNGHIFTDGGLLDNLPVDVAKSMGADVTLAVHLQVAKLEPTATLSSFGVMGRSVSVVIAANELRGIEQADLLITVPLQNYDSLDFNKYEEIVKAGYDAAQSKAAVLSPLSVDEPTWQAYLAERESRKRSVPVPQFVQVAGTKPVLAESIENDLKNNVGKPVNTNALEQQLMDLKGQGRFTSLSYQFMSKDDKQGLLITAAEKPYSPPVVQPLLELDGQNFSGTNFSMGARVTFQDFGAYRAEWRSDVIVGTQYGIASQYYRPLSAKSKFFIAPNIYANYLKYPIYAHDSFLAEYRRSSAGGGLDFGYEFGSVAQLTVGYTAAYSKFSPKIGDASLLPTVSGRFGSSTVRLALNDADNPIIPRSGQFGLVAASWIDSNPGAAHAFPLAEGIMTKFIYLNSPSSIYIGARGGTSFGNELVGIPAFSLGGNNGFAAYGENELLTNQYYQFHVGYVRKLAKLPVLLGEGVYFNGFGEVGKVFYPPERSQIPGDGAASIVINTIFGPIEIGGAVGATGHRRIFFKLGRIF